MQTTLLGLAIAFILALIAALVGPFFVDWNQFRPQFEAEASRVVGMPIRVGGKLDARLLPAPSLRMGAVTVGGANDLAKLRAERLEVEFSLGSLMRGEWRATELTIVGASADLGLNAQGRIDLPASTGPFNLGGLAIDRLNLTGRMALHDAASRSSVELNDIVFSGDVRSLASGAMRGDGNFMLHGARYPFRLSSGQTADGNGTRLRLSLDPGDRPLAIDLDGVLAIDNRAPRFDGALVMARPAAPKPAANGAQPWRVTAKVKADARAARFDAVEASIGPEQSALRLAGTAELKFGAATSLRASLAAKQLDADRALGSDPAAGDPVGPLPVLRALLAVPQPPLPVQIDVDAEQVMLGGRPLQNIAASLRSDTTAWAIDRLDLRAPGATRVMMSGGVRPGAADSFAGTVDIDSADPDTLTAWLTGRSDMGSRAQKPLRIHGDLTSAADHVAVQGLKADIDGGTVQGRVTYSFASAPSGSRLDADLKADRLDLDAAAGLLRSLVGPQGAWPDAGQVALDIGRAISAGQEMRPFVTQFAYSPQQVSLDRFKVGEATGLMLEGGGSFDRQEATGRFTLNANAASLKQISDILSPLAPALAARLNATAPAPGQAGISLALDLARDAQAGDRTVASAILNLDLPQAKGQTTIRAAPPAAALRGLDLDALWKTDLTMDARLAGPGRQIVALLGLSDMVAAGTAPLQLAASLQGNRQVPLRIKATLSGADLDGELTGEAEPWGTQPKGNLSLTMRRLNPAPLLDLPPSDAAAQNASLSSRVSWSGDRLGFEDIDGAIAGSRLRGRLGVTLGAVRSVDGQLGMDSVDVGPALGWALGIRGHDGAEPLSGGLLSRWRGQVTIQALRGVLPGGTEMQPVHAVVKGDGRSLSVEAITGKIGGGEVTADLDLRPSLAGYALGARVKLVNADGAALRYRSLAVPAGKASLQMTLTSEGRSASALQGALSGTGLLSLDGARIAGLDPRAFDVAIRASDSGQVANDDKLRQIVEPVLASGTIAVASAQIPFGIKDGRLRVGATTLEGDGVRAVVSGGYDSIADQADLRATLTGTSPGASNIRPEIQIFAVGTPDKLDRSVDVAALSSWLAVRAIDRETRRLDALERGDSPPAPTAEGNRPAARPAPRVAPPASVSASPGAATQQNAPLPAPIEIRPAPGTPRAPKARPAPAPPLSLIPPNPIPARPAL